MLSWTLYSAMLFQSLLNIKLVQNVGTHTFAKSGLKIETYSKLNPMFDSKNSLK